jgi:hypothetical protein
MFKRGQGKIETGSIVQCPVFEDYPEDPSEGDIRGVRTSSGESPHGSNSSGQIHFWLILSLLSHQGEENGRPVIAPYAHVQLCRHGNGSYPPTQYVEANSCTRMLRLGPSVREVLSIHACDQDRPPCAVDLKERTVSHSGHLVDEDDFCMYGRKESYPPELLSYDE